MSDETPPRPVEAPNHGRCDPGGGGDGSPFQTRAAFLANWDWQSVIRINAGACARGGAQHGFNSESSAACAADWAEWHEREVTLAAAYDTLREFHKRAPFLFFNGNTFAAIGRELSYALFSDLPALRKREVGSATAHYIAGVLDRTVMMQVVESLCASAELVPGTRVKTLRGSTHGVVLRVLEDGRVVWRTESGSELTALPESLKVEE
jgi:hypothetical protein